MEEPNTRLSAIKRHLSKPPTQARTLVLSAATSANEGTTVQLGRWQREDIIPLLADEIYSLIQEHSEATQSTVMASLYYLDNHSEQVGGNKVIRYAQERPVSDAHESLASLPSQLTGDSQSQAAQAQRHLEAVMRFQLQSNAMVLSQMRQLSDHTMDLCATLAERLAESESRERKATEKAEELQGVVDAVTSAEPGDQTTAAMDRLVKILEPVVPLIVQRALMSGAGGTTPTSGG